jgi:sugar-phosphatase
VVSKLEFRVRGLLIDLDGTLVDSTAVVDRSWGLIADSLGLPREDVVGRYHGITAAATVRLIAPTLPEVEVLALADRLNTAELETASEGQPLPGAVAFLENLPLDAWCVVTSGPRELALARLVGAGLPTPRHIVTADDVSESKPAPEPYLLGAAALGLETALCLAIEDAPAGVQSAREAGCEVLGLETTHDDLDSATVRDLAHLTWELHGAELVIRSR